MVVFLLVTPPMPLAFPTTRWTLIQAAGSGGPADREKALAELYQAYQLPVLAFIQSRCRTDQAQDLTQDFFVYILERPWLERADPNRGHFRSFLLGSLQNFLSNYQDYAGAAKRGGGRAFVPLDGMGGEMTAIPAQAGSQDNPERIFDRNYALAVVRQATFQLRAACEREGKGAQFERLQRFLAADPEPGQYRELAGQLALSEGSLRVAVCRMRRRYRDIIRAELAQTVASPDEVDEEVQYLLKALAS